MRRTAKVRLKATDGPNRGRRCHGCAAKRRLLDEDLRWLTCDEAKFCKRFDLSLITTLQLPRARTEEELGAHLEHCIATAQTLKARENYVSLELGRSAESVDDGRSLVALIQRVHVALFKDVFPFAGKTRGETGATVEVDTGPVHCFTGTAPAKVDQRLLDLCGRTWSAPDEIAPFPRWAANFLQRFFEIHPFSDGNGRTARSVVSLLAETRGFWFAPVRPFDDDGILSEREIERMERRDRKDYLWALRWAHKHRGCSPASKHVVERRDPLGPLERWLASRLLDYSALHAVEMEADPPDWWTDEPEPDEVDEA